MNTIEMKSSSSPLSFVLYIYFFIMIYYNNPLFLFQIIAQRITSEMFKKLTLSLLNCPPYKGSTKLYNLILRQCFDTIFTHNFAKTRLTNNKWNVSNSSMKNFCSELYSRKPLSIILYASTYLCHIVFYVLFSPYNY